MAMHLETRRADEKPMRLLSRRWAVPLKIMAAIPMGLAQAAAAGAAPVRGGPPESAFSSTSASSFASSSFSSSPLLSVVFAPGIIAADASGAPETIPGEGSMDPLPLNRALADSDLARALTELGAGG